MHSLGSGSGKKEKPKPTVIRPKATKIPNMYSTYNM